ncbi:MULTISPECIES: hypothetical protein [Sutcliffiella]|uniref:Uncharacterized protein n=1 Tax=Sutcliffiella cohnii TaxID=33932 RepID=A0A223KNS6_9BACI|nr:MULTISPECIES: hypothetical protein [Sutcliffiella]AST91132.1 hypothetical protein BC6307_07485 [Sutcliffiella cohnii]WBL16933.1 hypothetical protein O1A01_09990 [Sutcliffiella sp. NC1]
MSTKLREYIAIGCLLVINITVFLGLIDLLFPDNPTMTAGVLAFIGSIIGGGLTLMGVRWTLKKQANDRYIIEFPKKKQSLDTIIDNLTKINREDHSYVSYNFGPNEYDLSKFLRELKITATNVDGVVYNSIVDLEKTFKVYFEQVELYKEYQNVHQVGWTPLLTEESYLKLEQLKVKLVSDISEKIKELQDYDSKLDTKFFKIMNKGR